MLLKKDTFLGKVIESVQFRSRTCSSSGSSPSVLAEQVGRVMKITLNRPAVMNAQTAEMGDRLTEIVGDIGGKYESVGAVVVTGAGRAFSAGGDLNVRGRRAREATIDLLTAPHSSTRALAWPP